LTTAKAELAALINVPPGSDFKLEVPEKGGMTIPEWSMPVEQMEEAALINNPDLREQDYQSRIAIDDTHKELLKLLPGVTLSFSRQYDSNSFLVDNRWNDVGTKVTWNLINLLSAPDRLAHADSAEKVADAKRIALRMAVLAQVHVISHQFASAARQFERADKLWGIETRLAEASGNQQRGGTANDIERISTETSAIAAELRRFQTYAQMQSAYGKLQSTIGADPVPERVASHSLDGLSGAIVLAMPPVVKADAAPQAAPAVTEAVKADGLTEAEQSDVVADALGWLGRAISEKVQELSAPTKPDTAPTVLAPPATATPVSMTAEPAVSQVAQANPSDRHFDWLGRPINR
jgi:hypothetical protein